MSRKPVTPKIRRLVAIRARQCCEYCLARSDYAFHTFTVDHIIPIQIGGTDTLDNLAFACRRCNAYKHNRVAYYDPLTNVSAPLFHPRKDKWSVNFNWNADQSIILGVTASGRATIAALQVNRSAAVQLRLLLAQSGLHPPF